MMPARSMMMTKLYHKQARCIKKNNKPKVIRKTAFQLLTDKPESVKILVIILLIGI